MAKKIKYYKTINEIPVYTFFKVVQEKDYNYLIKKYDPEDNLKINDNFKTILKETFNKILERYNAINADAKTIKSLKAKSNISIMELEYEIVSESLKNYNLTESIEFLFVLNEVGGRFKFDPEKNITPQVNKALKNLKSFKMKIKIAKINYSNQYNLNVENNEKIDYLNELEKKAINIERILELKYSIDTQKTSLIKWCNLIKITQEKVKENGKT